MTVLASVTAAEKVAILLLLLTQDQVAEILQALSPEELEEVGRAMLAVQMLENEPVERILDEFLLTVRHESGIEGLKRQDLQRVLAHAIGEERAEPLLRRVGGATAALRLEILDWMDERDIVDCLAAEHPQVGAAILAHLDPERAMTIVRQIGVDRQVDILTRLAQLEPLSAAAVEDLDTLLRAYSRGGNTSVQRDDGKLRSAAKLIGALGPQVERRVTERLAQADPQKAKVIRELSMPFESIAALSARDLQQLLATLDLAVVARALKGAPQTVFQAVTAAMSSRAAAQLGDEMQDLQRLKLEDVQAARKAVVDQLRQMIERGQVAIAGASDYV